MFGKFVGKHLVGIIELILNGLVVWLFALCFVVVIMSPLLAGAVFTVLSVACLIEAMSSGIMSGMGFLAAVGGVLFGLAAMLVFIFRASSPGEQRSS